MVGDNTPVYPNGLYDGLFKPSPTHTLKTLNKIASKLNQEIEEAEKYMDPEQYPPGSMSQRGGFSSFNTW